MEENWPQLTGVFLVVTFYNHVKAFVATCENIVQVSADELSIKFKPEKRVKGWKIADWNVD